MSEQTGEARQGELLYLCSRLAAAIIAFHDDPIRSRAGRNNWWHRNLNIALVESSVIFQSNFIDYSTLAVCACSAWGYTSYEHFVRRSPVAPLCSTLVETRRQPSMVARLTGHQKSSFLASTSHAAVFVAVVVGPGLGCG